MTDFLIVGAWVVAIVLAGVVLWRWGKMHD